MPASRTFGMVDQAVKSITSVTEYINVGIDIANEVAMDFVENEKEESANQIEEFKKVVLDFLKMDRDLRQFQEAVDFVKQEAMYSEGPINLEEILDSRLGELKQGNDDSALVQHEKYTEFNQRIWEAQHPDEAMRTQTPATDEDVEMTQQNVNTRCPYTGKEMNQPMKNKICGHNYDKEGIMDYIKQRRKKAKCPVSGCGNDKPIELSDLEENKDLKRYIERKNRQTAKRK